MIHRRYFLRFIAMALLTGGLLAGCRHASQDGPTGGRQPTREGRDGGGGGGGSY